MCRDTIVGEVTNTQSDLGVRAAFRSDAYVTLAIPVPAHLHSDSEYP